MGQLTEVYSAVRDLDDLQVILKLYNGASSQRGLAWAQHEFDVLRAVAGPGTPEALEVVREHATPLLVMRHAPGISLARWVEAGLPSPAAFLRVALQLAEILERVHSARIIHCDVNPWNIVLDAGTLETHLIDFGLARRLGAAGRGLHASGGGLEGTLLYIAPEQTGRMNRGIDLRSDLYSLGASLYQALTRRPPFPLEDPLELIHAHIARMPAPPMELHPEQPQALSDLVLKLLRKEPDERHASASALQADLRLLQQQLERTGRIEPDFVLPAAETRERPRFRRKLHGRDPELAKLRMLESEATRGRARPLFLEGEPGCGKSTLVDALRPSVAQAGGYLVGAAFDLDRDRPYAGWQVALGSLVQQLLLESDLRLEQWKSELRAGLGNIAKALVELVPDLRFIVADVPAAPPLPPREAQARLSLSVQRFLRVCAHKSHPLVLFLDDLQWSDAGSCFLLEDLLSSELPEGLLLIGAYRPIDGDPAHPMAALLPRLAARGIAMESLTLSALDPEASAAMLAEVLERPLDEIRSFAQLVERRTGNNPLLIRQFVEHIHARGLLRWRPQEGWGWSLAEIAAADIPDGAVGLMTARIARLDAQARSLVKFASCVGDEFDLDVLVELSRVDRSELAQGLYALSDAGLIAPCPGGFRFVHGRIREAAQSLLTADERAGLHHEMARLLLSRVPEADQAQRAFAIVEHLNRGLTFVDGELRPAALRLNLAAGKQALQSGAATTAEGYLSVARRLLREEDWAAERSACFDLFLKSAESALLRQDFEASLALLRDLDARAPSLLESAHIEVKRLQVFVLTQPPEECTRHALEVMRRYGIRWPLHPSRLRARLALRRLLWKLRPETRRQLLYPAPRVDPSLLAPMMIAGIAGGVMVRADVNLVALVNCWVLDSNLRRGYITRPSFTLSSFATWIQCVLGDAPEAERLTRLALDWCEKVPDPSVQPRVDLQVHGILRPWRMRRRQALAPLDRVAESLRDLGDLEYAHYASWLKLSGSALAGQSVAEAERDFAHLADTVRRSGQHYPEAERCLQVYRLLLHPEQDAKVDAMLAESDAWIAANAGSAYVYLRTFWMLILCLRQRFDLALGQSDRIKDQLFTTVPYVHVADHTLLRGLAVAAVATQTHGATRRRHMNDLAGCVRRLRRWARHGPDFGHMEALLAAERSRLQGHLSSARALYDKAAHGAKEQEYTHYAALAFERRGLMLAERRRETEASVSLSEAIALYTRWGAVAKAATLEAQRKALLGR